MLSVLAAVFVVGLVDFTIACVRCQNDCHCMSYAVYLFLVLLMVVVADVCVCLC